MNKFDDLVTTIYGSYCAPSVNMVNLWKVVDMLPIEERDIVYALYTKDGERTEMSIASLGKEARKFYEKALRFLRHPQSQVMYLRPKDSEYSLSWQLGEVVKRLNEIEAHLKKIT